MIKLAINGGKPSVTLGQNKAMQWPNIGMEEIEAVKQVMMQPDYSFYEEGLRLEEEFSKYIGSKYALAHNNGTAAIHAALFAAGIDFGDEVIVPSYTWWSTCMPIVALNALPVFADIQEHSLNIDPKDIENKITKRTKAIVVVHLWGLPCEMDAIMDVADRHKLIVIEDASHAHGAVYKGKKTGSIGNIGCFSFQASKLLPVIEGGIMVTDNQEYFEKAMALGHYERLRNLSDSSPYKKYTNTGLGYKYRIHPAAAAMGRIKLKYFDSVNEIRNKNAEYLNKCLGKMEAFIPMAASEDCKRSYYGYRIRYNKEALGGLSIDRLIAALRAEGVSVGRERYFNQHMQPVYKEARERVQKISGKGIDTCDTHLPITENIHERLLMLPTFPQADNDLLDQYVEAFKKVIDGWEQIPDVEVKKEIIDGSRSLIR